jgi:hypothetical protein
VRVFGTIGWIVASSMASDIEKTAQPIMHAAMFAAAAAVFSFFLPSTPPSVSKDAPKSISSVLGIDVLKTHGDRDFWVFIIASLVICIPLGFYYAYANMYLTSINVPAASFKQSFGQWSEIGFMVALPFMFAWAVRYVAFGFGNWESTGGTVLVLFGILLHGICYDFFFVAGQIHIDRVLPPEMRARGQAFVSFVTLGVGAILGTKLSDVVFNGNTADGVSDWRAIWLIPAAMAGVTAILFAMFFRQSAKQ